MENLDIYVCVIAAVVAAVSTFVIVKFKKKAIPILLIVASVCAVAFYFLYKTQLKADSFVLELGDEVPNTPEEYLYGLNFAIEHSEVDITKTDNMHVGDYEIYVHHAWQDFVVNVHVEDTTKPELEVKQGDIYLQRKQRYELSDFLVSAFDLSGEVDLSLEVDYYDKPTDYVYYTDCGVKGFNVVARDINGNITSKEVVVIVDNPPEFCKLPDYYIATNQEVDYLEFITAYDEADGDVTDKIEVDITNLKSDIQGDYKITYSVTDSYGLTSRMNKMIHIYEPEELQKLIAYHDIDRNEDYIVGAINLYDAGLFRNSSIGDTLEILNDCFVRIRLDYDNGGWMFGSGYIMEVTEDSVIIGTCGHVVNNNKKMDVYFHDGTKISTKVVGYTGNKGQKDVGFMEIPISDIPESLLPTIKTVHIDEEYYVNLPRSDRNLSVGYRANDETGATWRQRDGYFADKAALMPSYESWGYLDEVTCPMYSGTSGSAIVSSEGYLIAMVSCTYYCNTGDGSRTHYYGTGLKDIMNSYREIFKRSIYTHAPIGADEGDVQAEDNSDAGESEDAA